LGTIVEDARCMVMLFAGNSHYRSDPSHQAGHRNLRGSIEIERAVLHVDEHPIEAAGLGYHGDVYGARLAHTHAQCRFTGCKLALRVIRISSNHESLSFAG